MNVIGITGKYTSALCYSADENIEIATFNQIKAICDNPLYEGCKIRMMPDMHPGKAGPIGLTIDIHDDTAIMPSLIGNDIGCGIRCIKFKPKHKLTKSDFQQLDALIKNNDRLCFDYELDTIIHRLPSYINKDAAAKNYGTIGGGNHFIEIDIDENEDYYLVIHTGSRSVGQNIYDYYNIAGHNVLANLPYEMTYLTGELKKRYVEDSSEALIYASMNRLNIALKIIDKMKWADEDYNIDISHNYIKWYGRDLDDAIIHKGSISAWDGQDVIIPINMRDGIILGKGKGNKKWNYSAPHGAGRILKRSEVANNVSLTMYKKSMEGIYSPSINKDTLDESPFAYRGIDTIKEAISDTVEIEHILKPVYNFKNGGK